MKITVDKQDLKHLDNLPDKVSKALSKSILVIEAKAKENLYAYGDLGDHGEVARSIHSEVEGVEGIVGVSAEAGWWYEMGTGKYSENGQGRPGWWVYIDDDYPHPKATVRKIYTQQEAKECMAWLISQGVPADKVHITEGSEAKPFLRPALHETKEAFKQQLAKSIKEEIINGN